ncbi:alpha/beta hydrolase [Dyadobacter bucti]|uniref:alpha/beta hydrolase n=1 Tax=Dyadobacter bucti TaxID=2572203 RepID=UPI003F718C3E
MKTKTVLFVTGAFVTHHCWDEWKVYFDNRGYTTIAPPWPFKDGTAAELRARQPHDTDLAKLTLAELIDHYADIARGLPEKPIIIGHSLGGLITQILLNRDLAAAAVAIHSVPPQGIIPYEFSFLKSTWGALGLFTSLDETYLMPFETWQYAFVNEMPLEAQQKAYDDFTAPESKRVARGGLTSAAHVDFDKPHAPLLLTSGSLDNIIPAHLNNRNYHRYKQNGSVLEYKEFPGRNHHLLAQPGWENDANYILDWIKNY